MTPWTGTLVQGRGYILVSHIVKMHYFFKTPGHDSDKLQCIVMMIKEGSTKNVNIMTHGDGVLMQGHGHISHYCEYALSSTISIYGILIAIVLWNYNAPFPCHC